MADSATASRPVVESDRVEGTPVYGASDGYIGTIKRLIIEKVSGRTVCAVVGIGGFLGLSEETHTVPWEKLSYDKKLGGYRTDIPENELRDAPDLSAAEFHDEVHDQPPQVPSPPAP